MIWSSWEAFFNMGGYGVYVWPSVGMWAAVAVLELWLVRRRHRRIVKRLHQEAALK